MEEELPRQNYHYMSKKVVTFDPSAKLTEVAKKMSEKNISCVVIVEGKKPIGIFTERDLIKKVVTKKKDIEGTLIRDVMTSPVKTISPDLDIIATGELMRRRGFRRFPVMQKEKLVGLVTETDITKGIIKLIRHLNWELVSMKITLEEYLSKLREIKII
jgi:CBS domain-containing protein